MAIYGYNFNCSDIPAGVKRKFARRTRMRRPDGSAAWAYLRGVGQSQEERDVMKVTIDNGHREIYIAERQTPAGIWYGIYST